MDDKITDLSVSQLHLIWNDEELRRTEGKKYKYEYKKNDLNDKSMTLQSYMRLFVDC